MPSGVTSNHWPAGPPLGPPLPIGIAIPPHSTDRLPPELAAPAPAEEVEPVPAADVAPPEPEPAELMVPAAPEVPSLGTPPEAEQLASPTTINASVLWCAKFIGFGLNSENFAGPEAECSAVARLQIHPEL